MRNRKFEKHSKIFQKIKKIQFRRHSNSKLVGKGSERENKYYRSLSFRFLPTRRVRENSKKIAKKFYKLKRFRYGFISSKNRLEKAKKEKK